MNHIDAMQENKQDVECNEEQILKKRIMMKLQMRQHVNMHNWKVGI